MAGLYIHVPFCHSKCAYCDFYSMPAPQLADRYIDAAIAEFGRRRSEISEAFSTIYLGGGTPSILTPQQLHRLIAAMPVSGVTEFTIEVNPEDVNGKTAEAWLSAGINRVSMGVQSFSDTELRAIGRRHSAADAVEAINTLKSSGFASISCDLIYGLPEQTPESWAASLSRMLGFGLQHLSAYCLSYEPGTVLTARVRNGRLSPTDDDTLRDMYDTLCRMAAEAGYEHYEISNFAIPGNRAVHNSSYWNSTPYLGIGPGAHSFDGKLRRVNPSNLKAYISDNYEFVVENETEDERFNDILITALRTSDGLDLGRLSSVCAERLLRDAARFISAGLMTRTGNVIRISESAWFTSDSIMMELMQ